MANSIVFQNKPEQLKSSILGYDGTNHKALSVNTKIIVFKKETASFSYFYKFTLDSLLSINPPSVSIFLASLYPNI